MRQKLAISIHALLAESDETQKPKPTRQNQFLSTLSLRRATPNFGGYIRSHKSFLSTLSLRRATCNFTQKRHPPHNFYPRSPCGERLVHALKFSNLMLFLSTLSLRRATNTIRKRQIIPIISIHALLAESDLGSRIYDMSAA